jgi:hypothetical protein
MLKGQPTLRAGVQSRFLDQKQWQRGSQDSSGCSCGSLVSKGGDGGPEGRAYAVAFAVAARGSGNR